MRHRGKKGALLAALAVSGGAIAASSAAAGGGHTAARASRPATRTAHRSAKTSEPASATPIKHVVVIFQENVSFDHYFGTYPQAANSDGQPFKKVSLFTAPGYDDMTGIGAPANGLIAALAKG